MAEIKPYEYSISGNFQRGLEGEPLDPEASKIQHLAKDSALNPAGYADVARNPALTAGAKTGYVAGRVVGDLLKDGTRVPWWALNHPLGQLYVASQPFTQVSGLVPDEASHDALLEKGIERPTEEQLKMQKAKELGLPYRDYHPAAQDAQLVGDDGVAVRVPRNKPFRVPYELAALAVPAMATAAAQLTSGNTDWLNLLGGGRVEGYEAILPQEGDKTETSNAAGELAARYLFGRTGRVLPWEEFTQERPEVSPQDYESYRAYQFDPGFLNLGLFRATDRNLEGEPEYMMMGYRVPLSTLTAAAGALAGGALGARVGDHFISERLRTQGEASVPEPLRVAGHRRLAGAAAGAILGALTGNVGGRVMNNVVIQPMINPEAVEADRVWRQQQEALGLL